MVVDAEVEARISWRLEVGDVDAEEDTLGRLAGSWIASTADEARM